MLSAAAQTGPFHHLWRRSVQRAADTDCAIGARSYPIDLNRGARASRAEPITLLQKTDQSRAGTAAAIDVGRSDNNVIGDYYVIKFMLPPLHTAPPNQGAMTPARPEVCVRATFSSHAQPTGSRRQRDSAASGCRCLNLCPSLSGAASRTQTMSVCVAAPSPTGKTFPIAFSRSPNRLRDGHSSRGGGAIWLNGAAARDKNRAAIDRWRAIAAAAQAIGPRMRLRAEDRSVPINYARRPGWRLM